MEKTSSGVFGMRFFLLPVCKFYINDIIHYIWFYVQLLWLKSHDCENTYVGACGSGLFVFMNIPHRQKSPFIINVVLSYFHLINVF